MLAFLGAVAALRVLDHHNLLDDRCVGHIRCELVREKADVARLYRVRPLVAVAASARIAAVTASEAQAVWVRRETDRQTAGVPAVASR